MIRALDRLHAALVAVVARFDRASDRLDGLRAAVEVARDELRRRAS